jgi:hypothetical protein
LPGMRATTIAPTSGIKVIRVRNGKFMGKQPP